MDDSYELIKYGIATAGMTAVVLGSILGLARYSYLKRKVEHETSAERTRAETAQIQDPAYRAHLAQEKKLNFLENYFDSRETYTRDHAENHETTKSLRAELEAVFGVCPNLENALQKMDEIQSEPPLSTP